MSTCGVGFPYKIQYDSGTSMAVEVLVGQVMSRRAFENIQVLALSHAQVARYSRGNKCEFLQFN